MTEQPDILQMTGISMEFPGVKALAEVTLTVKRGEIHAICGENGAGKSTLMKILSGVHPAGSYTGEIHYDGRLCDFRTIRDSEERGIVIIHQELALVPFLSITENIFLGNERARLGVIDWPEAERDASGLLARVGLEEHPRTRIVDIGVGKQQLVEIAKALAKRVELLILDEPTAALGVKQSGVVLKYTAAARDAGLGVVFITHNPHHAYLVGNHFIILKLGQAVLDKKRSDVGLDELTRQMAGGDELTELSHELQR